VSVACFVAADLSRVRLRGDGADAAWRRPNHDRQEGEPVVAYAQRLARDAAEFVDRSMGRGRRLGPVVVGVEGAICARVSAPGAAPDVVAAALAQREHEWAAGVATVQALAPARARGADRAGRVFTALEQPDAVIRLFLDELDRRGWSPPAVLSLWHALALDAPTGAGVSAEVIEHEGAIVWAWARDSWLVAGGQARAESDHGGSAPPAQPAGARRVALDWLAWAAQLGTTPQSVRIRGPRAEAIASAVTAAFADARVESSASDDALARALDAAVSASPDPADGRGCLCDLSNRPGRAHRRLGVWAAAAVLLAALAIGAWGHRQRRFAADARALAASIGADIRDRVARIDPRLADDPSPDRALASVLAQERDQHKPVEPPPAPMPIRAELARLAGALAAVVADAEDANAQMIKIDELLGESNVSVPDFATGEAIIERLSETPGAMRWTGSFLGAPPTTQRLQGVWVEDGS